MAIFRKTAKGVCIDDIEAAIKVIRDTKYSNPEYDVNPQALNAIYEYNKRDWLATLNDAWLVGRLQGIKQGIRYEKERLKGEHESE